MTVLDGSPARGGRLLPVLLAAAAYLVSGLVLAALANRGGPGPVQRAWRLAAWLVSVAIYATQIRDSHARLKSPPATNALDAALAAALGAFGFAVAAWLHDRTLPGPNRIRIALIVWPVMTGIPAFVVAWFAATLLARSRRPDA